MRRLTKEQLVWIEDNLDVGVFRNQQHFTDMFNALFGTDITRGSMANILARRGWSVKTSHNTSQWTEMMDEWLRGKYSECDFDFVSLAREFNARFGTDKSACCITKHLERIGVHKPRPKQKKIHCASSGNGNFRNRGMFVSGQPSSRGELPIGTIRYNSDGRPFIKVQLCNGAAGHKNGGHNYREPFWKPLQKKIWEDHYGPVPDGYVVCTLNGDPCDTDIWHIGLLDKRGTARMAKNDWWGIENVTTKKTAVRWCNLYYTAKDHGVFVRDRDEE